MNTVDLCYVAMLMVKWMWISKLTRPFEPEEKFKFDDDVDDVYEMMF